MTILLLSQELEQSTSRVSKVHEQPIDIILYRGFAKSGEHSEVYCIEHQFPTKGAALAYLRKHRETAREIEDSEALPWI